MAWTPPIQAEVDSYFERFNHWGRWSKDDLHGTLNLIIPAKREAAMRLAREVISCLWLGISRRIQTSTTLCCTLAIATAAMSPWTILGSSSTAPL